MRLDVSRAVSSRYEQYERDENLVSLRFEIAGGLTWRSRFVPGADLTTNPKSRMGMGRAESRGRSTLCATRGDNDDANGVRRSMSGAVGLTRQEKLSSR